MSPDRPHAGPGSDPYRDPDSEVLRNRLGITDAAMLEQADADFSASRLAQLRRRPLPDNYDLQHLCAFHQHIFGDVYPWAGEIRTVAIFKGDPFCLPQHIESFGTEVFTALPTATICEIATASTSSTV